MYKDRIIDRQIKIDLVNLISGKNISDAERIIASLALDYKQEIMTEPGRKSIEIAFNDGQWYINIIRDETDDKLTERIEQSS